MFLVAEFLFVVVVVVVGVGVFGCGVGEGEKVVGCGSSGCFFGSLKGFKGLLVFFGVVFQMCNRKSVVKKEHCFLARFLGKISTVFKYH